VQNGLSAGRAPYLWGVESTTEYTPSAHPAAPTEQPRPRLAVPRRDAYPEALAQPVFDALAAASEAVGQPAYVIGGYVRDFLLGHAGTDVDVVTLGSGTTLAQAFADHIGTRDVAVYENFGTALVNAGEWKVEFVGARRESYRKDSRKPIVENGSLDDDQRRRDFTINALSLALQRSSWGALHDPFGGLDHLDAGLLCTPLDPDLTFSDDPLRMFRAVRFAARLGFAIHPDTYAALSRNADRISIVSMERITDEMNKMLLATKPSAAFKTLFKVGLLQRVFPEFCRLHGVERINGRGHKDNFYHTLQVVDNLCAMSDDLWLRWSAMLHDIAKPATKRYDPVEGWTFHGHEERGARMVPGIFQRLRLPQNEHMKYVQKLVRLHLRPIALADGEVTDSAIRRLIVDAGDDLPDLMKLCRADITTRDARKHERYLANFDLVEQRVEEVTERDNLRNWQPPVTGELIMTTFGIAPSKQVGEIKERIRNAILDGEIPNQREAAIALMLDAGQALGLMPVLKPS